MNTIKLTGSIKYVHHHLKQNVYTIKIGRKFKVKFYSAEQFKKGDILYIVGELYIKGNEIFVDTKKIKVIYSFIDRERVRQKVKEKGKTMSWLYDFYLGMRPRTVQAYLKGERTPSERFIRLINQFMES